MSLVPAMMCTTRGLSAMTSACMRTSSCGVVCALMPRPTLPFEKNAGSVRAQPSVIESPRNTRVHFRATRDELRVVVAITRQPRPVVKQAAAGCSAGAVLAARRTARRRAPELRAPLPEMPTINDTTVQLDFMRVLLFSASRAWSIYSSSTPRVSGKTTSTTKNCTTMQTAKNTKGNACVYSRDHEESLADDRVHAPVRGAAQGLAARANGCRKYLAEVHPDHGALRKAKKEMNMISMASR